MPPALTQRPFRRADALALGLTRDVLRGSRFRRIFRDVYVCATTPDSAGVRFDAAKLLLPVAAAASHQLAAQLFGVPVPGTDCTHLCIPMRGRQYEIAGLRVHRVRPETPIALVGGRRVTAPATTFLQLAEALRLVDLVVVGDAMVRLCLVRAADLIAGAARWHGRGAVLARRAAALVRPRVDSPMETRLRLLLVLAGLPEPAINLAAHDLLGRWLARPDLSYAAQRLAVEYDGRHHRDRADQWTRDLARRERLERGGWRVLIVTAEQLHGDPVGVALRVAGAVRTRGGGDCRARLTPEWRSLFQGRRG